MRNSGKKKLRKLTHEKKLLDAIAPNYVSIGAFAEYSDTTEIPNHSLMSIFSIKKEELNEFGELFSKKKNTDDNYGELLNQFSICADAYQQFQDLMDLSFNEIDDVKKTKEHLFHRNYLYYESLVYLRNIAINVLNANALSALALIRPFSELAIFYLYFRYLSDKKGLNKYYGWINGNNGKPPFYDALEYVINEQKEVYGTLEILIENQVRIINEYYKELSSYNHTPKITESIGQMSGGYGPSHLNDVAYSVLCINNILSSLCVLFSIARPMILFPMNEYEKFGFNGPVGIYSDIANNAIFRKAIDPKIMEQLVSIMKVAEKVNNLQEYCNSQKILDENEIRNTYKPHESENIEDIKIAKLKH